MAAPDAKTSPSNKEVQQSSDDTAKVAAAAAVVVVTSPATETTITETTTQDATIAAAPSYASSESSEKYVLAKSLLSSGDFEQALELIEEAIQETRAVLVSMNVSDTDLHESMAPFHYLYGTTLLYSIEESTDDTQQMTVGPPGGEDAAVAMADPSSEGAAASSSSSTPAPETAAATDAQNVEDMEIAWENLDTARNIVEAMLQVATTTTTDNSDSFVMTPEFQHKVQLDLAQILLREGDLQRMNGRYAEAIMDYEACLQLRKLLLPPYDRKIADAQYNLGLSYLSNSTELQKEDPQQTDEANALAAATKIKVGQEHCQKGVQLYVGCAQTLCGQIASLCAVDPSAILSASSTSSAEGDTTTTAKGGFKTTGMDEADVALSTASLSLSAWRKAVASLTPVEEDDPRLADLRELLDEIQETVDEAERSQVAVREATQLRIRAQKAAESEDGVVVDSGDGVTTQIGFGQPTLDVGAVAVAATAAKPMMVVKKKKKRDVADSTPTTGEEQPDAKRAKTE